MIRPLSPSDDITPLVSDYLTELWKNGGDVPHTDEAVHGMVEASRNGHCLVYGEPVIGWISAVPNPLQPTWPTIYGKSCLNLGIYIAPGHRRKGIATQLRVAFQEVLRELGYDTMLAGVHLGNEGGAASLPSGLFTPVAVMGYERLK